MIIRAPNFLPHVDGIVVFNDGTIDEQGSYAKIYRQNERLWQIVDPSRNALRILTRSPTNREPPSPGRVPRPMRLLPLPQSVVLLGGLNIRAAGGWKIFFALVLSISFQQPCAIVMNRWLVWWFHTNPAGRVKPFHQRYGTHRPTPHISQIFQATAGPDSLISASPSLAVVSSSSLVPSCPSSNGSSSAPTVLTSVN